MGEETNPKPAATEAMDVDGAAAFPVAVEGSGEVASLLDKLMANVVLIDHAVMTKEQKLISSRLLRQTQGLKKELTPQGVIDFVKRLFSDGGAASMDDGEGLARRTGGNLERITRALGECASLAEGAPLDWTSPVVEQAGPGQPGGDADNAGDAGNAGNAGEGKDGTKEGGTGPSSVPENLTVNPDILEIYVYLVTCMVLVDSKAWKDALSLSQVGIQLAMRVNSRIVDPISSRLCSIMSLAAEKLGMLDQIRGTLLQLHRAAVLRHDSIGQETLLNLLLRNYLSFKLYNQAEALRAKAQPAVYKSSTQHCRLLYYHGRIQAVLLEYSDAKDALVQASRKAPQSARGFRLEVAKWLVVVRLLLGEVPSRSELAPADLRSMMAPYFDLARAVGRGDVGVFDSVASKYQEEFERDDLRHVVARLRANVIRSGVRRIASAYSRITLLDIAKKLGLPNVSDAEYIVAKAIRDGGIVAQLDHESGIMTCPSVSDVYSTDEPLNAFHARIAFCLDIHNEAVTAIRHDPTSMKKHWNEDTKENEGVDIQDALMDAFFDEY
mmetsp:Transcript_1718/g.5732  ORF Transcript_1718/g.5732 Transcript_1718/m.5732 type:complete len:553 (-) Transcript_1718:121-1779(-)